MSRLVGCDCTVALQWCFLLASFGYYVALCVVSGIHHQWLTFGFALSMAVLAVLCLFFRVVVQRAARAMCDCPTRRGSRQTWLLPHLIDDANDEGNDARSHSRATHDSDGTLVDAISTQRPGDVVHEGLETGKSEQGNAELPNPLCPAAAAAGQASLSVAAGGDGARAPCRTSNLGSPVSTTSAAEQGALGAAKTAAAVIVQSAVPPLNHACTAPRQACSSALLQLCSCLTIVVTALCFASSFAIFYDTRCLSNALPALCGPAWWGCMAGPMFRCYSHYDAVAPGHPRRRPASTRVLRLLLHWGTVALICLVALGIYVAAEVTAFVHFYLNDASARSFVLPRAVAVVSGLSALPLACVAYLYVAVLLRGAAWAREWPAPARRRRSRRARTTPRGTACGSCRLAPRLAAASRDGATVSSDGVLHGGTEARQRSLQTGSLHADCGDDTLTSITNDDCADSFATTRSTGDSALTQGPLLLPLGGNRAVSTTNSHSDGTSLTASPFVARALPSLTTSMMPQTRTLTVLYLAYRGIEAAKAGGTGPEAEGGEGRPHVRKHRGLLHPAAIANYQDLIELVQEAMQDKEGAPLDWSSVVLTTHDDALCLVWGLLPCVADLVLLAVRTAEYLLSLAQRRPPSALLSRHTLGLTADGEAKLPLSRRLVTAVVYAPHSPLSVIGNGAFRSVHFFRPDQHATGMMLLRRGELLYQRMPCRAVGDAADEHPSAFRGIVIDSRAAFNAAQGVLSRPCGVVCEAQGVGLARSVRSGIVASAPSYQIMYDFVRFITVKEDEWHLMVQYRAQLSRSFAYLDAAAQLLQQGNRDGALKALQDALQDEANHCDQNCITLATIMSEDLQRIK